MRITEEVLLEMGFVKSDNPAFYTYSYELGRGRALVVFSPGSANEVMSIMDRDDFSTVILHNWDYDGPLTKEKIDALIWCLTKSIPKDEGVQV